MLGKLYVVVKHDKGWVSSIPGKNVSVYNKDDLILIVENPLSTVSLVKSLSKFGVGFIDSDYGIKEL